MLEVSTTNCIVHALRGEQLANVLIIGDDMQLPPTLISNVNPAKANGEVSLMERLSAAGWPVIELLEQYRMHPTISRITNSRIYGGRLRDGKITTTRPRTAHFQKFVGILVDGTNNTLRKLQKPIIDRFDRKTCSLFISPTPSKEIFPTFASQRMPGSTSSYNLQTANMVVRMVDFLVHFGKFAPSENWSHHSTKIKYIYTKRQ